MTLPNLNAVPMAPTHTPAKVYTGQRPADDDIGDCRVYVRTGEREAYLRHVKHHSDGFEWGYGGSGPADLALSILEDYLDEPEKPVGLFRGFCGARAWALHQSFKWQIVAGLPHTRWTLSSEQIAEWLAIQAPPAVPPREDGVDDDSPLEA